METQKRSLHEVSRTKHAFSDDTRDVLTTPINFPLEANTSVDPIIVIVSKSQSHKEQFGH